MTPDFIPLSMDHEGNQVTPRPGAMRQSIWLSYTATKWVHLLWVPWPIALINLMDFIPASVTVWP